MKKLFKLHIILVLTLTFSSCSFSKPNKVTEPTASIKSVIISAHYDHIVSQKGKIIRGALDNASVVAALLEIAQNLKAKSLEKPFDMDIVVYSFNAEEFGMQGSSAFVKEIKSKYTNLYNINIDCIGAKQGGNLALKNKSQVSDKLYTSMKSAFKKNNIEFSDTSVKGVSDYLSFENAKIPNIFIVQESIKVLVHVPTDTPEILDFKEIKKLFNAICDFIETNNGVTF